MGVGVCSNATCARFALLQPTRNLYPHTLLPGSGGAEPPSTRQAMGKPTTAFEKSKQIEIFESSQNGLNRSGMGRNGCGSAFKWCFCAFCGGKAYSEPLSPHALSGGSGGRSPPARAKAGKISPEEVKKSKFLKSSEMLRNNGRG